MIYFYHFRPTVKQLLELPAVKKAKDRRARELYLKHTVQSVKSSVESALWPLVIKINQIISMLLLHFVAFFRVASLLSIGVDNWKVGADNRKVEVDNKKALELDNSTVFHRGRQQKSSRARQQNIFFRVWPHFSIKKSPKNATKHPVTL